MRKVFLSLLSIITTTTMATAQDAVPAAMTLQDCIDYAMKHSYTVKNAQLDVLIQQSQNSQTAALALPSISGKTDLTYFIRPQSQFIPANAFSPAAPKDMVIPVAFAVPYAASVGLSGSQILFDGSVLVALQVRQTVLQLAVQNKVVTEDALKYNITKTYNSVLITRHQYDLLGRSLALLRDMNREIKATSEAGFIEKIEVERMEVQVNSLANDSMRIANLLMLTEQVLKYQMGMDIAAPVTIAKQNLDDHIQQATALLAEEKNYTRIPEYNLVNTALTLSEYNLKRYKLAALPTVAAFGAAGSNYGANSFGDIYKVKHWESNSLVGLQLTVPIFNGMRRVHQVEEAKLNITKSKNNIESLKQGLDFMTEQAKTGLRNALIQLKTQKRNIALAEDVLDLAQKKYKAGVGSNLEVTTAQSEQLRAQNSYFTTMLDIVNAEADLKKALGLL